MHHSHFLFFPRMQSFPSPPSYYLQHSYLSRFNLSLEIFNVAFCNHFIIHCTFSPLKFCHFRAPLYFHFHLPPPPHKLQGSSLSNLLIFQTVFLFQISVLLYLYVLCWVFFLPTLKQNKILYLPHTILPLLFSSHSAFLPTFHPHPIETVPAKVIQ